MMLLEVFVQFIEGSFYIYWFNNFNNVNNRTLRTVQIGRRVTNIISRIGNYLVNPFTGTNEESNNSEEEN